MMRLSQAQAAAQRFGRVQPIEFANVADLRGQNVVLSARVRMSASTIVRYAILEWTGTADSPTVNVVRDWTSGTYTPNNFFLTSNLAVTATGSTSLTAGTLATISLSGTVSNAMNNLYVFFWTDSAQSQNVTLDVGKVQLEVGSVPTPLAFRDYNEELTLCRRYYEQIGMTIVVSSNYSNTSWFKTTKRIVPSITLVAGSVGGATYGVVGLSPLDGMRQLTNSNGAYDALFAISARM